MREIGGYIELDTYHLPMRHEGAIALNCGRNALAYLITARKIEKLFLPSFLCDSVFGVCKKMGVPYECYPITEGFRPKFQKKLREGEWLYVVNFYGQLTDGEIAAWKTLHGRVIVDNAQSYFQMPVEGVDTLYTCRKFFGVPDGAFLYTDAEWKGRLPQDESFGRMRFLLGRYERGAGEFYQEYVANNGLFAGEAVKRMSRLTRNLLRGIDYRAVGETRRDNFLCLDRHLGVCNRLRPTAPYGAFMYPLLVRDGPEVRKGLLWHKIYVPVLWPNVLEDCGKDTLEYSFAANIIPLPVDQRYGRKDMEYIAEVVKGCLG